jgi:hypothetical protein
MTRKSTSDYPSNWKEIAHQVKESAGWKCVRCGHDHDVETGHVLTVHHLDLDPQNCEWWNIVPLCQRCHLHIQAVVRMEQHYMFEHSAWFKPYVAGYFAHIHGHPTDKPWVIDHLDMLLDYGRTFHTPTLVPAGEAAA